MMTTNLYVIANVKQLRTDGSFRILLPFFRTSRCVDILNSAIFNSVHIRVEFGTILEGLRNFGGGGCLNTPKPTPPRYATESGNVRRYQPAFFFFFRRQLCTIIVQIVISLAIFVWIYWAFLRYQIKNIR